MKKSYIIALALIAIAVAAILSTVSDSSTYASFSMAADHPKKEFHVVGKLIKEKPQWKEIPIIFPIHPRTLKMVKQFRFGGYFSSTGKPRGLWMTDPLGYLELLHLNMNAMMVITDTRRSPGAVALTFAVTVAWAESVS